MTSAQLTDEQLHDFINDANQYGIPRAIAKLAMRQVMAPIIDKLCEKRRPSGKIDMRRFRRNLRRLSKQK